MDSRQNSVRITLRIPKEIHRAVAEQAQREHRSLNNQIVFSLEASTKDNHDAHEKAPSVATA